MKILLWTNIPLFIIGFVTFPDDGYSTDLGNRSTEMISQSTKLLSSIMNETEIDTSVQDDVLMDMDSL